MWRLLLLLCLTLPGCDRDEGPMLGTAGQRGDLQTMSPGVPNIINVSGTAYDGNTITFTGSDFGARSVDHSVWMGGLNGLQSQLPVGATPLEWGSDFGEVVSVGVCEPEIATGASHSRDKGIYCLKNSTLGCINSGFLWEPGDWTEGYFTWWARYHDVSCAGTTGQHKLARLSASPHADNVSDWPNEILITSYSPCGGTWTYMANILYTTWPCMYSCNDWDPCGVWSYPPGVSLPARYYPPSGINHFDNWARFEVFTKTSSVPDARDAEHFVRVSIPGQGRVVVVDWDDMCTYRDGMPFTTPCDPTPPLSTLDELQTYPTTAKSHFMLQNWSYGSIFEAKIDDVYFMTGDGARARVEIGNAATFAACDRIEVQEVVSWSPTQTVIKFNKASHPNGTAYAYLIDKDGVVSNNGVGKPINIVDDPGGGGPCKGCPPPQGAQGGGGGEALAFPDTLLDIK